MTLLVGGCGGETGALCGLTLSGTGSPSMVLFLVYILRKRSLQSGQLFLV